MKAAEDELEAPRRQSLMLVDDDPGSVQVLAGMLQGLGDLRFALSGAEAIRLALERPPDVMLVDAEMPAMSGFDLCATLHADPLMCDIPVIIVTSHVEVAFEVAGFAAGAADFIRKPPVADVVVARVRTQLRLKALSDTLRSSALKDGLTGLANRRCFDRDLRAELARARRSQTWLGLLMIDIDNFKKLNDRYGHQQGDACLRSVADALAAAVRRPPDLAARFGGEEFAVLLPHSDLNGAAEVATRILQSISALAMPNADSPLGGMLTVSIGVASLLPTVGGSEDALERDEGQALLMAADQALYAAKAAGRARISLSRRAAPNAFASGDLDCGGLLAPTET